jgi:hypothetical protein
LNLKNNLIYEKSKVKAFGKNPKRGMGATKHFVQEKSKSKLVELRTKSNVGPTADSKQPMPTLSKSEIVQKIVLSKCLYQLPNVCIIQGFNRS